MRMDRSRQVEPCLSKTSLPNANMGAEQATGPTLRCDLFMVSPCCEGRALYCKVSRQKNGRDLRWRPTGGKRFLVGR